MKKLLLITIACIVMAFCFACADNQNNDDNTPHVHTPGAEATCTTDQVCTECQEVLTPAKGHEFSTEWYKNEDSHWKQCACGERQSEASHVASLRDSNETEHWRKCVCGAEFSRATHDFASWNKNEEKHWKQCECGAKAQESNHEFGDWTLQEGTDTELRSCECGEVQSRSIDNVKEVIVNGYEQTLSFLDVFDSSDIEMTLVFDDNSQRTIENKDLVFNFDQFSASKLGKQLITVGAIGLTLTETIEVEVVPATSLSILMIGNSFSDDTSQWVNEICADLGIDVVIGNMYIGGCTLATHYSNLVANSNAYAYRTYDSNSKTWVTRSNTSIQYAIESYDWDLISLQQASGSSGVDSTYNLLGSIISEIYELKADARFVWNMTWAYQQNSTHGEFYKYDKDQTTMYEAIMSAVQSKVLVNKNIEAVIPNGTAVQNVRTSYLGDNITRDGYHLSYTLGRYVAGLTLVASLTGADISEITYAPNSVSKNEIAIAIEAVQNAVKEPFKVTPSTYTTEPAVDLTGLVEVDCHTIGCAYYVSTDANNYNKLVTTVSNSNKFAATRRFTKEQLPVGSIIEIKSGFQYRPEAWLGDYVMTSRPENVTTKIVVVDEDWWGDYTIRAFNISSTSGGTINTVGVKEFCDALSVYVPESAYEEEVNGYADGDKTLFINNSLDINDYTLYDYSVTNGFYDSGTQTTPTVIHNNSNLSAKFIATEQFTVQTLPIGSVLIVDSGYRYRPDAWEGEAVNSNRPGNVTTNFVIIDEDWWGNYTVRTFNVSALNASAINQVGFETSLRFRIYLPN